MTMLASPPPSAAVQPHSLAQLAEGWQARSRAVAVGASDAVAAVRDRAYAALGDGLSWPGSRAEAWRHTSLGSLPEQAWQPASDTAFDLAATTAALATLPPAQVRLCFVNGHHAAQLSCGVSDAVHPAGLMVGNLRDVAESFPAAAAHLGASQLHHHEAFAALNTTQLGDGAVVVAPKNFRQAQPVQLVFLTTNAGSAATATQPRVLVVVEGGAELSVSEHHLDVATHGSGKAAPSWSNAVTELVLAANAKLDYAVLQHQGSGHVHLAAVAAQLGRDARLGLYTFDDGSKLCRRAVQVRLQEAGAEASLGHVALARAGQHQATQATLQHAAGHTRSRQVFKTVVSARGSSAFGGLVDILTNAPKAAAEQMSRALLLEKNAQAYLQPQLQILTDDVRCAHGATVGQLSPEALFYLMSRGIAAEAAKQLLTFAFLDDALRTAPATLRPLFLRRAAHWLGTDLGADMVAEADALAGEREATS